MQTWGLSCCSGSPEQKTPAVLQTLGLWGAGEGRGRSGRVLGTEPEWGRCPPGFPFSPHKEASAGPEDLTPALRNPGMKELGLE